MTNTKDTGRFAIDKAQIKRFVSAMFRYADDDTYVSLRAFYDDRDGVFEIKHVIANDRNAVIEAAAAMTQRCALSKSATVFCPPVATFTSAEKADESHLANGLALSVECDQHPLSAQRILEELFGSASIIVQSGGEWVNSETGEIENKLHLHWRLNEPTRTPEDHKLLKEARALATSLVGGDASNKPIVHPIRWPGSWHRKKTPKLARVVSETDNEINLSEIVEKLRDAVEILIGSPNNGDKKTEQANDTSGESRDTAVLVAAIMSGREYHAPLTALAMRLLKGGTPDAQVVSLLRGIMQGVPEHLRDMKDGVLQPRRWQSRYDDIPRAVSTARGKIAASNTAWEAPILFDAATGVDIPANLLPAPFSGFAKALAEATETPQSMATLVVLGILSLILSRKYRVAANAGHTETLNLYIFITMEPGNRKSGVFNAALEPVIAWEKCKWQELLPNINIKKSERLTQERIIESKRKKAAGAKNPAEQKALIEEVAEMEINLPTIPILPQLFVTDATPESLRYKVAEQDGVLGALSDEGGIVDVIAGLYTGGNANIDIILKGIEGGHVRVERKGESISLRPYLTFVLVVQPAVLDTMAEKKSFAGRGVLERFLYCIPQTSLGFRTHDKYPVSETTKKDYTNAIDALLNIPDNKEYGELVQQRIEVEPTALGEWKNFQMKIETMMRSGGTLSGCTGWASKLPGFVLRIAAILYIARHYKNINTIKAVDQDAMNSALILGTLLVKHGEVAFQTMVCDQFTRQSRALWQWIVAQGKESISRSDITYGVKNRTLGKAETLDTLLAELIRRHLLHERKEETGGRPVTVYNINPQALKQNND